MRNLYLAELTPFLAKLAEIDNRSIFEHSSTNLLFLAPNRPLSTMASELGEGMGVWGYWGKEDNGKVRFTKILVEDLISEDECIARLLPLQRFETDNSGTVDFVLRALRTVPNDSILQDFFKWAELQSAGMDHYPSYKEACEYLDRTQFTLPE